MKRSFVLSVFLVVLSFSISATTFKKIDGVKVSNGQTSISCEPGSGWRKCGEEEDPLGVFDLGVFLMKDTQQFNALGSSVGNTEPSYYIEINHRFMETSPLINTPCTKSKSLDYSKVIDGMTLGDMDKVQLYEFRNGVRKLIPTPKGKRFNVIIDISKFTIGCSSLIATVGFRVELI